VLGNVLTRTRRMGAGQTEGDPHRLLLADLGAKLQADRLRATAGAESRGQEDQRASSSSLAMSAFPSNVRAQPPRCRGLTVIPE
jgi:hypothetical protein